MRLAGRKQVFRKLSVMLALLGAFVMPQAIRADLALGDANKFGLLFEGGGINTLQVTNVSVLGNVGVGGTGKMTDSGPSTITGNIYFSAANTGQFSSNNAANVYGGPFFNSAWVSSILTNLNSLNATYGAEAGTSVSINHTTTINASAGVLDSHGNRVFKVTGFNTTNSDILTINGDAAGDSVILNFANSVNFNNQVVLKGISASQVLYNFVGGSNLTGGPTLQVNNNSSSHLGDVQGMFLDPNGPISVTNADVLGGVFGGDTHDFQYVSGSAIDAPGGQVPEPNTVVLLGLMLAITVSASRTKLRLRAPRD